MTCPAPPFRHLLRLTDHVGLLEHAEGIVPQHQHGYCVDDVARGLVVVCREPSPASELVTLARRYLYFLARAQAPDGRFRNRLGYDRRWNDEPISCSSLTRTDITVSSGSESAASSRPAMKQRATTLSAGTRCENFVPTQVHAI